MCAGGALVTAAGLSCAGHSGGNETSCDQGFPCAGREPGYTPFEYITFTDEEINHSLCIQVGRPGSRVRLSLTGTQGFPFCTVIPSDVPPAWALLGAHASFSSANIQACPLQRW